MTKEQISVRPFVIVGVLVGIASVAVGAFMGFASSLIYMPWETSPDVRLHVAFGPILGGICGLAAAWIWCRCVIWPLYAHLKRDPTLIRPIFRRGIRWGMLVGTGAGVMVHLALMYATGKWNVVGVIVGAVCGIVSGALTGLVCSFLAGVAMGFVMRNRPWNPADDAS